MRLFKLPEGSRFSNKQIFLFLWPIFLEQLMIAGMSIADTYMVSYISESAVAGVSLVTSIDKLVKQIFIALAAGGSVVLSQYIGAKDRVNSALALKTNIHSVFFLCCAVTLTLLLLKKQVLNLLFGGVETSVMENSVGYFSLTVLSYPFLALYNVGSASYRAMGNSRIPLFASIGMMSLNLVLKYVFIFKMNMGVSGAGLSTMLALATVGIVLVFSLCNIHNRVHVNKLFRIEKDFPMLKRIFHIALPNGIENGLFQLGLVLVQGLVSTLGTASIAANAIAMNVTPLAYSLAAAFSLGIITFVGQCMGAGKPDEAEMYAKHILKINYFFLGINCIILLIFTKQLVSMFNISAEAAVMSKNILRVYFTGSLLLYPLSFALPNALRGAGDTRFTMTVSIISMFAVRIGLAYVLVLVFKLGVVGVWLAMILDWVDRTVAFMIRFRKGKWKKIEVI